MKRAPDYLREGAAVFEGRNAAYGNSYQEFGRLMMALFPSGVHVEGERDMARLGVFVQMASKMQRYANNFNSGGHSDSTLDLSVYSAMLHELDANAALASQVGEL